MKNYSVMTLEIFSSSKLFLRASDVVGPVCDEYSKCSKYCRNSESTFAQLSHHLCHGYTASRKASPRSTVIRGIHSSHEYSHSSSTEKINIFLPQKLKYFSEKYFSHFSFFILKYFLFL